MVATNSFFEWFYYGLSGLGGWFIFLLLALIAVIWLLYDSANRRLPALGWRMGAILTAALLLPAILYRFTVDPLAPTTSPLAPFSEPIFYLGVLGGILPIVLAIGYFVTYQGMVGCPNGHVYEAILGKCPYDTPPAQPVSFVSPPAPPIRQSEPHYEGGGSRIEKRVPKAHAWLVSSHGDHQLNQGLTTVGRSAQNDICLTGDATVSRSHAKIMEENGHFRLVDLGSRTGTRLNGHVVRQPVMLASDDEIQFGDDTVVRFVTGQR